MVTQATERKKERWLAKAFVPYPYIFLVNYLIHSSKTVWSNHLETCQVLELAMLVKI